MAQTYNPGASNRDRVRFRIADNLATMVLQDAEIDDLLTNFTYNEACAQACESIAAYYSRKADEWQDAETHRKFTNRVSYYEKLAESIRKAGQQPGGPARTGAATAQMSTPDLKNYRTT